MAEGPAEKKCAPCAGLAADAVLSPEEAAQRVQGRPLWRFADGPPRLIREFTAKNFKAAMAFLNAAGEIAEEQGHHPDFHLTNYREVSVVVSTHELGGLTENDFILAEVLDERTKVEYSPKWLKEHPQAEPTATATATQGG
mmetsp:Transcript_61398/g.192455  ORF Transcript_61398/g.192455 Transcript_61398/m.192455 type:complete len:141 (+) Transcript_61398:1-423(+)